MSDAFPPPRPPRPQPGEVDHLLVGTLTWGLAAAILLQKVAVAQFELTWFATTATVAVLFWRGRLRVSLHRLLLYLLAMSLACCAEAFAHAGTVTSLLLTLLIALPFVAVAEATPATRLAFLRRFQLLGLLACGLVLVDVAVQLLGLPMPSLDALLPDSLRFNTYVYIQPVAWHSAYDKPNGLFFLEASYASQFLALALVVELAHFRRLPHIVAYGLAMMAVGAGTGFVMVLLALPFFIRPLLRHCLTPRLVAAGLGLGLLVGAGAVATGFVDRMAARTAEFDRHGQSGNARFVAPFATLADQFTVAPTAELMWGNGAGSQDKSTDLMLIPPTKMILEFGAPTFFCYLLFAAVFLFEGSRSFFALSAALTVDFLFINGGTVQPITAGLGYILVAVWVPRRTRAAVRHASPGRSEPAVIAGPLFG